MNTVSQENLYTTQHGEQSVEKLSSETIESPQTLNNLFSQIEDIQRAQNTNEKGMTRLDEVVGHLDVDGTQVEEAKSEIGFNQKSENITKKWDQAKRKFEEATRKALLPVVTALSLHAFPGIAQEVPIEPLQDSVGTALIEKSHELTEEDVFDKKSPLALASEKMQSPEKKSSEELALIKDFSYKVWFDNNEWTSRSGADSQGSPLTEVKETGKTGGIVMFDHEMSQEKISMHTHPVEVSDMLGSSAREIRTGEQQPFVMPPSATDIGSCMSNSGVIHRVVDPRGVWEYQCDTQHPFVLKQKKLETQLRTLADTVKRDFSVAPADSTRALSSVKNTHPSMIIQKYFSELEKQYPGIEEYGNSALKKIVQENQDMAMRIVNQEKLGASLIGSSFVLSDTELSEKIKNYIQQAETLGVSLSYTPFREKPIQKEKE